MSWSVGLKCHLWKRDTYFAFELSVYFFYIFKKKKKSQIKAREGLKKKKKSTHTHAHTHFADRFAFIGVLSTS